MTGDESKVIVPCTGVCQGWGQGGEASVGVRVLGSLWGPGVSQAHGWNLAFSSRSVRAAGSCD